MESTGREALLAAFDRLFDRAATKLNLSCTPQEREEVRRNFVERYDEALRVLDQTQFPTIPEAALEKMEASIDEISLAQVAGYLATGPLAVQVQEFLRTQALRAAEQRLIEHLTNQADDKYGGN